MARVSGEESPWVYRIVLSLRRWKWVPGVSCVEGERVMGVGIMASEGQGGEGALGSVRGAPFSGKGSHLGPGPGTAPPQ